MDKRLRSSLQTSADDFLTTAAKLPFKTSKTTLKNLINTSIKPQSDISATLPLALHNSIQTSISDFKNSPNTQSTSPVTPPAKRVRRSGRNAKTEDDVSKIGKKTSSTVDKIIIYAYVLRLCVFHPNKVFNDADLLPIARLLHDNLILFESDSVLLLEIACLCEEWWKGGLEGKETLISQSLPVILSRSLTLKKKVDVHRVYSLRDAFLLFEFEDESIEDLKSLLIRCVISPLYLKTEDGRKFVAFMFGLSVQVGKEVFAMIKSQVPFGRKSMLEAYGEILFRAWKAGEGECKDEIENRMLMGLFEGAIYAGTEALAASIRRILGGFVSHRTVEGVEKLIFRLAEPLIFRSLQVANSNVRQNALYLLLDLFPLEDPDATKEASGTLLEKQFFLMEKLLMDECPDVRVVAVEGCCRTLHLFWEVIPSSTITKIITRIFDHMSIDACTEVRLSTVNGVMYLIDNPQSHEILKVLLPRLGKLIKDPASNVRAAIVDLLLLVNDISNFHFHKVVPLEELLTTLANDVPNISKKITSLLIPSYFPSAITEEEACNRCITLIRRSPMAGARFCEFAASEGASLKSLTKLVKVITGLTTSTVKLGEDQIDGLLLATSHLCTGLVKDASLRKAVKEELSGEKIKALFKFASTSNAQSSVCNIISTMSLDSVDDLFEECMGIITKCSGLPDSIVRQTEARSAHKMIMSCGWFDDMFEILTEFLEKAARACHEKVGVELGKSSAQSAKRRKTKSSAKVSSKSRNTSGKKSTSKKDTFCDDYAIASGVAWQMKDLLLSENSRTAILSSEYLERAFTSLKVISEASVVHSFKNEFLDISAISAYTALALHLALHNVKIDGCPISTQGNISELTMNHLFHCMYKVYEQSGKLPEETPEGIRNGESQTGDHLAEQKTTAYMVKMSTAVLKFVTDATVMDLVPTNQERILMSTAQILKFIFTRLRAQSISLSELTEESLKEIYHCVKSSMSYAAKLLNVTVKGSDDSLPLSGIYGLVHEIFNLFVSVEQFLGYGFAARLLSVVRPWIPDLILALGSHCLLKQSPEEGCSYNPFDNRNAIFLPTWLNILARIELHEGRDNGTDDETSEEVFSAFKKLLETVSQLLKENSDVLDAVGVIFLAGSLKALDSKNFEVVLGLVRFVCVKLVGNDEEWSKYKLMLASFQNVYSVVEKETEDCNSSEDDRQNLFAIRELLEPVSVSFMYEKRSHSMEEEVL